MEPPKKKQKKQNLKNLNPASRVCGRFMQGNCVCSIIIRPHNNFLLYWTVKKPSDVNKKLGKIPAAKFWRPHLSPLNTYGMYPDQTRYLQVLRHLLPGTTRNLCPNLAVAWILLSEDGGVDSEPPTDDERNWVDRFFGVDTHQMFYTSDQRDACVVVTDHVTDQIRRETHFWRSVYTFKRHALQQGPPATTFMIGDDMVPESIKRICTQLDEQSHKQVFDEKLRSIIHRLPRAERMRRNDVIAICHLLTNRGWWRYENHLFFVPAVPIGAADVENDAVINDDDNYMYMVVPIGRMDVVDRFSRMRQIMYDCDCA